LLVGHCRHATRGSPSINRNNPPHKTRGRWIISNGVVHNWQPWVEKYERRMKSECDREVLALLISQPSGNLLERVAWAVKQAEVPLPCLSCGRARLRGLPLAGTNPFRFP
jgi:glucosamine 6-phosphate synthetase-like amidotransferase/phosphosugar isomerase protein